MKFSIKSHLFCTLTIALSLFLTACGGNTDTAAPSAANSLSGPPAAAPASNLLTIAGSRNAYLITRSAIGFSLANKDGSGSPYAVPASITGIQFNDFTINLGVGDKSKTIDAASLKSLVELYIAFFNRVPDADGMSYWIDKIKSGVTVDQLSNNFYTSAVAYAIYSDSMTNDAFVRVIYKNVLGRNEVDQEGLDYWTAALANGSRTRGALVATIIDAAHGYKGDAQYGWVADLLDNKITVGKFFSIQEGLNYNTDTDSITQGMAIAALVTATDILAAKAKISVTDPIDLTIAIPSTSVNILMTTSMGNILIALDPARAPITTANFLKYTNAGFYTNKIFHRVIPGFMIQGGGFTADLVQAATYAPIKLEVGNGLSNLRGTIAMARTNVLDSATSQFFINVVDNTFLDTSGGGYAVFGKVLSGMDVADKIVAVQTKTVGGFQNVPVAPITIISVAQVN